MKNFLFLLSLTISFNILAGSTALYKIKSGKLHDKGKVKITILPDPRKYRVQMEYELRKRNLVPVPNKLLNGKTVMEFPQEFRTEAGYRKLENKKTMQIPKAELRFIRRADVGDLKGAYLIQVHPTNKKSKIDITYHPSLPSVGWKDIKITFLSKLPVLDGYKVEAIVKN